MVCSSNCSSSPTSACPRPRPLNLKPPKGMSIPDDTAWVLMNVVPASMPRASSQAWDSFVVQIEEGGTGFLDGLRDRFPDLRFHQLP